MKRALLCLLIMLLPLPLLLLHRSFCEGEEEGPRLGLDMCALPANRSGCRAMPAGCIPWGAEENSEKGSTLFARHCAACHGNAGNGQSYCAAQAEMPAVGDLTQSSKNEEEIQNCLLHGQGAMPAFGRRLRPSEIQSLNQHIRNLR